MRAAHYGAAVVPARLRKPGDKAKVEVAVQMATRWIIAKLRHRRFFSLARSTLPSENWSRTSTPALRGISEPAGVRCSTRSSVVRSGRCRSSPTSTRNGRNARSGKRHYYSVPHALLRETVWVRIAARTIEVFHHGKRIAVHMRSSSNRRHTTVREHIEPPALCRLDAGAEPAAGRGDRAQYRDAGRDHHARALSEQGFRASVGIVRLAGELWPRPARRT
jgi:hypothetical protein